MKDLEAIKERYAKSAGYKNWKEFEMYADAGEIINSVDVITEQYTKEAVNNALQEAAEKDQMKYHNGHIAKKVILDELEENSHPERVEDVIFWALESYCQRKKGTMGEMIAYAIKQRILDEEKDDHDRQVDNILDQ